jgi:hypothetical protein
MNKRILRIIGLSILILMIVSLPVLAAGYTATISVVNSSATAYTETPLMLAQNNSYLASNGYINSSGSDVLVKDNGTSIPLMLTDKQTWFVPSSLAANTSHDFQWSSGNTPPTDKQIITGNGGYVTITYSGDLELGAAWKMEWAGVPASDSVFAYKANCYWIFMSGGSLYAQVGNDSAPDASVDTTLSLVYHTIVVGMDGVDIYIIIDGGTPVITAYSGSVPTAIEDTIVLQDVPYSDYFKIFVVVPP